MERLCLLMLQHLIVQLHMGNVGMRVLDDAHGFMPAGVGMRLDVELLLRILGMDMDAARRGIDPRRFAVLRRGGGQHLQPIGGTSRNAAERGSDLQSHHAGAGNAHAHGVLQNVGADPQHDLFRAAAQRLRGLRHRQRHGDRLRAAQRRLDLPVQRVQILLTIHLISP